MVANIPLLENVRIASPCSALWEQMDRVDGEDRVRFCGQCKRNVFNLSALTRREAEVLIRGHDGRLCVRYYRREDGTILTADCPVGVAAARRMFLMRLGTAASLLALMLDLAYSQRIRESPPPVLGDIACKRQPVEVIQSPPPVKEIPIRSHYAGMGVEMGEVATWTGDPNKERQALPDHDEK